jgi:pyruvate,water dikinase
MSTLYAKPLRDASRRDILSVGGKAALLGELLSLDISVPAGFVVCTSAFSRFLDFHGLADSIRKGIVDLRRGIVPVKQYSDEITDFILNGAMPSDIAREIQDRHKELGAALTAVRSSATAEDGAENSWAGQLESYLNVTADGLLRSVKKCWASLFSERALTYALHRAGDHEAVQVAVVVQEMINPEAAGIAFSVDPVTENRDQIIIEAGFGLGEAIVQGQITPDHYVVEKHSFFVVDKYLSPQERGIYRLADGSTGWKFLDARDATRQKLPDEDISTLARMTASIERLVKFPCDVEWVYENGRFKIVQCRPITTLS